MLLHLQYHGVGEIFARPVIRLAMGTIMAHMDEAGPAAYFRDIDDFGISIKMVRMEQAGLGVPMDSPPKPGRIAQRKSERLITIDIHYNEINMVLDRIASDQPDGRTMPVSQDYLDTFVERIDTALGAIGAWCDRKKAWADKDLFDSRWQSVRTALENGRLDRPYEFTVNPVMRDALDASWSLCEAAGPSTEQYESLTEAYFRLRDVGWQDAAYDADPTQPVGPRGQPAMVSNFHANIASSPPPDAGFTYSFA
jgi:hypothetical protein